MTAKRSYGIYGRGPADEESRRLCRVKYGERRLSRFLLGRP